MRHVVTLRGGMGFEDVFVEANSGDEAAAKAYRPGTFVVYVGPAPADEAPGLKAERRKHVAGMVSEAVAKGD